MSELFGIAFVVALLGSMVGIVWHDKKESRIAWGLVIGAIVVMVLQWNTYQVSAQPNIVDKPVATFYTTCTDRHANGSATIYWGYDANAKMDFMGSGYKFTTQVGHFPKAFTYAVPNEALADLQPLGLGYFDHSMPGVEQAAYTVYFKPTLGSPACSVLSEPTKAVTIYQVQPTSTPSQDNCPAYAVDGITGQKICLWSLPKANSGG